MVWRLEKRLRVKSSLRIDEYLPDYHFHEIHSTCVDAPASQTYQAVKMVTPSEIRLFTIFMTLRSLSLRFIRLARVPPLRAVPMVDLFQQAGFVLLAEEVGREVVLGVAGKFWTPAQRVAPCSPKTPEEFLTFSAPDHVKVAVNFLVEGNGRMSRVITETRIYALDKTARRKFALYWLLVRPGSALIRRDWLGAIRKRAKAKM
jgi:hypothetical protein